MKVETFKEFCTGCGLCQSVCDVQFTTDDKGYKIPDLSNEDVKFCSKVCPASGNASKYMSRNTVWGNYITAKAGWAEDGNIRNMASSGGVLTALCCYLLETGTVDGVIQIKASSKIPYQTETVVSRTKEDVINCAGSRYSISQPLLDITSVIQKDEKYAVVAKPCDISALRMYMMDNPDIANNIAFLFSFFCAGMPSEDAQKKLISTLGCESVEDVSKLQYRGNGWPGYATAVNRDGKKFQMNYEDSWGKILGRDVRKCCRFCFDGVGEFADVACGDLWYLTEDNTPDFSEAEGRNIIFARTSEGKKLLEEAQVNGYLHLEEANVSQLRYAQRYQYDRKIFMSAMTFGMAILGRNYPKYDRKVMNAFAKLKPFHVRLRRTLGIIKRIKNGKI